MPETPPATSPSKENNPARKKAGVNFDEIASDSYDASEKPFDFVEEEGETVLVCTSDSSMLSKIQPILESMEYHMTTVEDARDALKKMRFHLYDLILVDENFDTSDPDSNSILIYLERLTMDVRRNMFVALITSRFRTMDNMMAFNKSVNIVINTSNLNNIDKVLKKSIAENNLFYKIFRETLKAIGRA
jgi:CheY-like chemotaxis protein